MNLNYTLKRLTLLALIVASCYLAPNFSFAQTCNPNATIFDLTEDCDGNAIIPGPKIDPQPIDNGGIFVVDVDFSCFGISITGSANGNNTGNPANPVMIISTNTGSVPDEDDDLELNIGNVLILAENGNTDDNAAGGEICIDFDELAYLCEFSYGDLEESGSYIAGCDENGAEVWRLEDIATEDGEVETINLVDELGSDYQGIRKLKIVSAGSGAFLSDIEFIPESENPCELIVTDMSPFTCIDDEVSVTVNVEWKFAPADEDLTIELLGLDGNENPVPITVAGDNPFTIPATGRPINGSQAVVFELNTNGNYIAEVMFTTISCGNENTFSQDTDCPLPVDLVAFKAVSTACHTVELSWQTASEVNHAYFELQRSIDAKFFETITIFKGEGDYFENRYYAFEDNLTKEGSYYYRLKQVDQDDSYQYSNIVAAMKDCEKPSFQIYPTIVTSGTEIFISLSEAVDQKFDIYDMQGRLVTEIEPKDSSVGKVAISIVLPSLERGVYFVKDLNRNVQRIVVQ